MTLILGVAVNLLRKPKFEVIKALDKQKSRDSMNGKRKFYEEFASLHLGRVGEFFNQVISKEKFITSLIFISVEGISDSDPILSSNSSCFSLNSFIDCDLYRAELIGMVYENEDFTFTYVIQIKNVSAEDDEYHLSFLLSTRKDGYEVSDERLELKGGRKEFWKKLTLRTQGESTFGTLKRM